MTIKSRRGRWPRYSDGQRQASSGVRDQRGLPVCLLYQPSACSIRQCTTVPAQDPADMEVVAKDRCPVSHEIEGVATQAARVQSHARPSRRAMGISYPEIYEMQARAIFEAVVRGPEEGGKDG